MALYYPSQIKMDNSPVTKDNVYGQIQSVHPFKIFKAIATTCLAESEKALVFPSIPVFMSKDSS